MILARECNRREVEAAVAMGAIAEWVAGTRVADMAAAEWVRKVRPTKNARRCRSCYALRRD